MADPTQVNATSVRTVGLVASHRSWRSDFARYVQDHITGLRVRVLRDPRAIDDSIDVVIIDDSSTFLNRESLRKLDEAGVQVIGIYDPNEHQGQGQAHLNQLGIADVASAELTASQLVQLIQEVSRDAEAEAEPHPTHPITEPSPAVAAATRALVGELPTDTGIIVAVGGPATLGAVEVAVGLAASFADDHGPTLLVDVDESTPLVAARLGYRLEPTVLDAVERLYYGDGDLAASVTGPTQGSRGFVPMHVLAGIANPDDWALFGHDRCGDLLRRAADQWKQVVAVSGPRIEALPTGADRYGSSRGAVASAHVAIGVCDPSPSGVLQALDWLIEAKKLRSGRPVWVVFAGRPRSTRQRADLVDSITREAGSDFVAGVLFVPLGSDVDRSSWEGTVVSGGRFVKAMKSMTDELRPVASRSRLRLRRRNR